MGLIDKIFKPKATSQNVSKLQEYVDVYTPYAAHFTPYTDGFYENELTRSAIHAKAKHTAKLKPNILGGAYKSLEKTLQTQPNPFQSTYDFLYRARTIYEVETTVFIIPLYSEDLLSVIGFYPIHPSKTELMEYNKEIWLRYTFANGERAALEWSKVGVLSKMGYKAEFFGDGNNALNPALQMLSLQKQGIQEGIKTGAMIRFMGKIGRTLNPDDLEKERKQFTMTNLSSDNKTGMLIYDAKYDNVQQIKSEPYIINDGQMDYIKNSIYSYFGVNEDILQNKFNEDLWNAFYEGEIEPFAIQLSLAITNMLFTKKEKAFGNEVHFSANRLQYASNKSKLDVSTQLFDRGLIGTDDVAEIWNMAKTGENKKYIRREYAEIGALEETPSVLHEELEQEDGDN